MKRLFKWIGFVLLALLIILLCVLFLSYMLLGTDKGFKLSVAQLEERIDGLQIGEMAGNLNNGIQTDRIDFKNEQIALSAEGVDSQWRSDCLLNKEICIDQIIIDKLKIETFASDEKAPASPDDIALPDIVLPVSFNAKNMLVKNLEFKAPGDAPAQILKDITLSAHTEQNTLHIDELSTQYQNIRVHTTGKITPTNDYPLAMNINIDAEDIVDDHDISTEIKLSNSLENLNVDVLVAGTVSVDIQGQLQPLQRELPAELTIKTEQIGWPLDTMQVAKAEDLIVQIDGDMDDYRFSLSGHASGEQIPDTQLKLAGAANTQRALLTEITALTLDGLATGNAAVSWDNGVTWVTELIAKDINPAKKFEAVDGKLNGNIVAEGDLVDGKWTLDLSKASVNGELRGLPFNLDSKLSKHSNDTWQLDSLILDNGPNRINAKGTLSDKWDVNADISLPELQNLLPELRGGFKAQLKLNGEIENPDVLLSASSDSVKFQEITIDGLNLKADVKRGALSKSTLALDVAKVIAGEQDVSNTRLRLNGTREAHTLDLFADGPQKTSIDMLASGGLNSSFDWSGVLSKVTLELPAHEIVLRDPTELAWNNETKKFSVDPHCWAIQDSSLCLKNQVLAQEEGQAVVVLDNYGLKQLNPFLQANSEMGGILNSTVTVNWGSEFEGGYAIQLDSAVANGAINVRDEKGQSLLFKYDTLTLKSSADAKALNSKLTIDSDTMGMAQLNLVMDPASENKNITGDVDLTGFKLDFLNAFLPNFDALEGSVSAKGDISGELLDPLFNGQVVVSSIVIRADDLPLEIDDGRLTAKINGKRADIDGDIKTGEGNLSVSGTANWVNNTYRADIKLNGNKLNIVQDPLTSSTVNAKLTVSVRPERIRVRGNIDIPAAQINIKELPRGAATLSEDVIVVEEIFAQTQSRREEKASETFIDLKVNVNLGDDVNLSGYGLIASLTGNIAVSQASPNPVQLGGEVTIPEGTFKKYGQDLTITDGQVLFVGPIDQTSLNIDAVRDIKGEERTAGLHLAGRIEDPEITLFTEPADKTQESILSYIVLGRDFGEASSGERSILASAALALTLKGGQAISDSVAGSIGVQDITLDAQTSGDETEVTVSSQVNDRLLVRYGRGVFEGSNTLYLRYDLTKQLYLEAAQGTDRAVDIFYKFAF